MVRMTRTPIFDELYAKYVAGTSERESAAAPTPKVTLPAPQESWEDQAASCQAALSQAALAQSSLAQSSLAQPALTGQTALQHALTPSPAALSHTGRHQTPEWPTAE